MKHDNHNATVHSHLMAAAKVRAHQLRTQAITHFWNEAGRALGRALKAATGVMYGRVRRAQACSQGV